MIRLTDLAYSLLKNRYLYIFFLLLPLLQSYGQGDILVCNDSISIKTPTAVSIDRGGMIYYADKKGSLLKYDSELNLINEFSPQQTGQIDLIDAWNPLRIFLFYQARQEYTILNRFLVGPTRYSVQNITDYAAIVSSSLDNNIWVADLTEFGLKKYDTKFDQIVIETPFDLLLNTKDYNLTHLRAYKNRLFIGDSESGILVFDNLGNYLKTISEKNVNYFNFLNDEIYFLKDGQIVLIDIYAGNKRTLLSAQLKEAKFVLMSEKNIYIFSEQKIKACNLIK